MKIKTFTMERLWNFKHSRLIVKLPPSNIHMWMCQINHQFSPTKPRCWFWYVGNVGWIQNFKKRETFTIALKRQYVYSALLCTAVLYSDWSLQMGQMGYLLNRKLKNISNILKSTSWFRGWKLMFDLTHSHIRTCSVQWSKSNTKIKTFDQFGTP